MKKLVHIDEKAMHPKDRVGSAPVIGNISEVPQRDLTAKSIIGKPSIYDLKGNLLASEENLVVLLGREYLAQLLAGTQGNNPDNLLQYKISHFGVGDQNPTGISPPPTTVGPFDDDVDLANRVKINNVSSTFPSKYIDDGKLKQIISDGEISVVSEEHTINTTSGGQKVVDAYTAVRYRMYLQPNEPIVKPFRFNEAGLYAVKHRLDSGTGQWVPATDPSTGDYIYTLFARFTTLDKNLDAGDGIMIEWYILV